MVGFHTAERERRADILRLRKRFLKDKEKESIIFAKKEIQSQRTKRVGRLSLIGICIVIYDVFPNILVCVLQERRADLKIRQDAQVTLYRSYRVGDLPDIQIQYSSLIAPLQALAQVHCDSGLFSQHV